MHSAKNHLKCLQPICGPWERQQVKVPGSTRGRESRAVQQAGEWRKTGSSMTENRELNLRTSGSDDCKHYKKIITPTSYVCMTLQKDATYTECAICVKTASLLFDSLSRVCVCVCVCLYVCVCVCLCVCVCGSALPLAKQNLQLFTQ